MIARPPIRAIWLTVLVSGTAGVLASSVSEGSAAPAAASSAPAAASSAHATRYSLVGTCQTIRSRASGQALGAGSGPFRMQAAALATYLLYGVHQDYLGDSGAGAPSSMSSPSAATEWQLSGSSGRGFTLKDLGTGTSIPVSFRPAGGCAVYPEAQVDASGTPAAGPSPEAAVQGTAEGHAHVTAFEFLGGDFHCGRPWSPFGAPYALPASCAHYQQGVNGAFQTLLDYGGPTRPSDMHGWPTFREWPSPTSLSEEGDYYTGIERAWKAGLRVFVTQLVDNEELCKVMTVKHNPCNDMAAAHIQSRDLYALQDYIDAQSGGPGKGWFRVVTDPFQARRVINQGKLAVIEGIEVSRILGCGEHSGVPECNRAQIDAGLKEVHDLGVRTFFPVHEFDNAFGGTKGISGDTGAVVNTGNRNATGNYMSMQPCPAQDQDAEQTTVSPAGPAAQFLNGPASSLLGGNPLPVYQSGPQCNTRGLTDLGAYLIRQMIKQHLIIQLDHMDSKTADAALSIAQSQHYAGVVSAHCCSSPQLFQRIYQTGGTITEPVSTPASFIAQMKVDRAQRTPAYEFGFGWGSDLNGLGGQPGPTAANPISYPFKSFDGRVTFTREQWGQRVFDLNTDGLANYGMYADWLQEFRQIGGPGIAADMFHGAEAYLQMWERSDGVPARSCRSSMGYFSAAGTRVLRLGASYQSLLLSLGQPSARPGRSYRYCVDRSPGASIAAVFNSRGTAALLTSTARGYGANDIHPGASAQSLRGRAKPFMSGVWIGSRLSGGARLIYGVSRGLVRYVGVAAGSELVSRRTLRSDLRAAGTP